MIRKERKTWWALLLVAALLIGLLPTAVLAENGSAGFGVDYIVSSDADAPEQEPAEEELDEPEEEEPVEEPEEELTEDVALQMMAPLSMTRAATTPKPGDGITIEAEDGIVPISATYGDTVFPLHLDDGAKVRLQDVDIDYSSKYPGCSPIEVAAGATATIIIDGNVTLKGGNASGTTGAAPAIHVPAGSTLYIESTGVRDTNNNPVDSLTVYGGNAAKGGDGTMSEYDRCDSGYTWYGGQGGEGGGGAAPAIGGKGGKGGEAPDRQAPMYNGNPVMYSVNDGLLYISFTGKVGSDTDSDVIVDNDTLKNPSEWKFDPLPKTVNKGEAGESGTGAGNVYITGSLVLSGSGGNSAGGGTGGAGNDGTANNPGECKTTFDAPKAYKGVIFFATDENSDETNSSQTAGTDCFVFFSGGGGGGGGGGGCAAPLIGTGGAGGSSGGSGAPPVLNFFVGLYTENYTGDYSGKGTIDTSSAPGGAGGGGGWPNGGGGGGGGAAEWQEGNGHIYNPGNGGSSGNDGTAGTEGNAYPWMFGDKANFGGAGGEKGNSGTDSAGAAGGQGFTSTYTGFEIDSKKSYTFPAGGSGGVATGPVAYTSTSNIVLSTGVKKGDTLSSGTGYRDTLYGGGYGYQGVQPKTPIGIYDLADCTLTVLSRETTPSDGVDAETQTYTGHNYAPKLCNFTLIATNDPNDLDIEVNYTHADNTLVPQDCLKDIEKGTGAETASSSSHRYLMNLGIDKSTAEVEGHSTLINVGDTYQIKGLSPDQAVRRALGTDIQKAAAVGTWTDKLEIVPVSLTGVDITAKEGDTTLTTDNFLSTVIKKDVTPKVTLNYTWSDKTNSLDDLWSLLSKAYDSNNADATRLEAKWTVTTPDSETPKQFAGTRTWRKGSGSSAEVKHQEWDNEEHEWKSEVDGSGEVVVDKENTGIGKGDSGSESETTTTEFPKVSTSSASYTFDKPGEYTFTLTLSGMGYETKTASFTVKVKQQIEVTVEFGDAGKWGNRGESSTEKAWNVHPNQTMKITADGLPEGATAKLTLVYPYHNKTEDNAGTFKRVVGTVTATGNSLDYTPTNAIVEGQTGGTTVQVYVSEVTSTGDYYVWDSSSVVAVPTLNDDPNVDCYASGLPTIYVTTHNYAATDGFCTVEMVNSGEDTTPCGEYQPAEMNSEGYMITNAGQLYWFAAMVNGDDTHVHDYEQKNNNNQFQPMAYLENDVNLASVYNPNKVTDSAGEIKYEWIPIGRNATVTKDSGGNYTTGAKRIIFKGNKHTISGLYISKVYNKFSGFIAVAGQNSSVSSLTLKGDMILPSNNGTSVDTGIGSVVGWGRKLTLTDVTSEVNISGDGLYHVGGLVGCTRGGSSSEKSKINRCIYEGDIKLTSSTDSIGGIAGCAHWANISYSANRGTISTTNDAESKHDNLVGGIAGQLENGSIENCYSSTIPTQSDKKMGGLVGTLRSTATVENSVYPSGTDAIVNKESGSNSTPNFTAVSAFNTGEACYLANGMTSTANSGIQFWYQNIDNAASLNGENPDGHPRLQREFASKEEANAAIVYQMPDGAHYSNGQPVYSVNVSWGSMLFTYQQGAWRPDKHDYDGAWKPDGDDANKITITNSGDWKVNTNIRFSADGAFSGKVNGIIKQNGEAWSGTIIEGKKDSGNSSGGTASTELELSRASGTGTYITESEMTGTEPKKIGTVTVTITDGYAS